MAPYKTAFDFLNINMVEVKKQFQFKPAFRNIKSSQLMIRGKNFYAICNPNTGMWTTNEYEARELIDAEVYKVYDQYILEHPAAVEVPIPVTICESSQMVDEWIKYCTKQLPDNFEPLDQRITFANDKVGATDYRSKRVPYELAEGETPAWDRLMNVLYAPKERHKIEWAIGSIVDGPHVREVQKYYVIYGQGGTGKSTILDIMDQTLFPGYCSHFKAAQLVDSNNSFNLDSLKTNPLVALDDEAKLSKIGDNSFMNSVAAGEKVSMNLKFQSAFETQLNTTMFMAANEPPQITDRNAGSVRRMIDIQPTGNLIPTDEYFDLMAAMKLEAGAIAWRCKQVYLSNPRYYRNYKPTVFMSLTDPMYNFIIENLHELKTVKEAKVKDWYMLYKQWCESYGFEAPKRTVFKQQFSPYWEKQKLNPDRFEGFKADELDYECAEFEPPEPPKKKEPLKLEETTSLIDTLLADCPAQYKDANADKPATAWDRVTTTLKDLDTSKEHYVRVPINHIVIDLDIKDSNGEKSPEANLQRAVELGLPETYAEFSKSGGGVHLHYIYDGDPTELSSVLEPNVEVKVYKGKSSLRRRLSYCNAIDICHLKPGSLPKKEVIDTVSEQHIKDERHLINCINKALRKETSQPYTKPCMDFIAHCLDDAYKSGIQYDVTVLKPQIISFASSSTHNAQECLKIANSLHYASVDPVTEEEYSSKAPIVIFDVEVFPNFFGICWMKDGGNEVYRMINPTAMEVLKLTRYRLIGFNNAGYDDYILYAAMLGYNNQELYELSKMITSSDKQTKELWNKIKWGELSGAKQVSYCDIYDYSSKKQSLKKFEIELGIHHQELGLPWDEPVPEEMWSTVMDYCENDVRATMTLFHSKDRWADYKARLILADVAGMPARTSTNNLTKKIIFGDDKKPQWMFNYRNLADPHPTKPYFPGYTFDNGVSMYKGFEVGEGGFVWAKPGMYQNVVTFDVASMHPTSIIEEELFGPTYTKRFQEIKDARVAIKHKDFEAAREMLDGALGPYLDDPGEAKMLAQALKIAINSVYGLTSAKFENAFRDPRNIDNIVAKRGALFMIDLLTDLQAKGVEVIHIKTDSIKVVNPSIDIQNYILDFGKRYGYTFEIEHIFERICLVNNAVYVARLRDDDPDNPGEWTATGAQFAVPYVFKSLFSHEQINLADFCEVKNVSGGAIYLDFDDHKTFVGKVGAFTPVTAKGGTMVKLADKDGKYSAVVGTKGYKWLEYEYVLLQNMDMYVDLSYYDRLVDAAKDTIAQFGDVEWFIDI